MTATAAPAATARRAACRSATAAVSLTRPEPGWRTSAAPTPTDPPGAITVMTDDEKRQTWPGNGPCALCYMRYWHTRKECTK